MDDTLQFHRQMARLPGLFIAGGLFNKITAASSMTRDMNTGIQRHFNPVPSLQSARELAQVRMTPPHRGRLPVNQLCWLRTTGAAICACAQLLGSRFDIEFRGKLWLKGNQKDCTINACMPSAQTNVAFSLSDGPRRKLFY